MGAIGAQTKHLFCESHTCTRAGHWLKHEFFFLPNQMPGTLVKKRPAVQIRGLHLLC